MFWAGRRAEVTPVTRVCVFLRIELPQQLHPFDSWLHPVSRSWDWSYGNDANTAVVRILLDGKKEGWRIRRTPYLVTFKESQDNLFFVCCPICQL